MIKNKYKNDFERKSAGQYEYVGKHFTLPMDEKQKKHAAVFNLVVAFGFLALELLAGVINPDSSRTVWIVFPYLFLFLPIAYMGIGSYSFFTVPLRMQHSEYEGSILRMKHSCIGVMVLAGINIVLDLIFMLLHISGLQVLQEVFYLLCFVLMEVLGIFYGRRYDRLYGAIAVDE